MYTIKIYEEYDTILIAKEALRKKMYVSGWDLSYLLQEISNARKFDCFIIGAYAAEELVGILVGDHDEGYVQVFVRKAHRRQGIGTAMYTEAAKILGKNIRNKFGIDGSEEFFDEVKELVFGRNWKAILEESDYFD